MFYSLVRSNVFITRPPVKLTTLPSPSNSTLSAKIIEIAWIFDSKYDSLLFFNSYLIPKLYLHVYSIITFF